VQCTDGQGQGVLMEGLVCGQGVLMEGLVCSAQVIRVSL
jgi:hypothetical protein